MGEIEMIGIFRMAIAKKLEMNEKPGNSDKPWNNFNADWLATRLGHEIIEWSDNPNDIDELLDIINMAAFVAIRLQYYPNEVSRRPIDCHILDDN